MRAILDFIIKHNHWFLFILLEGISVMLIVRFNNYQSAAFFTSANSVAGTLYGISSDVGDYFQLRGENEGLLEQNKQLILELTELRRELTELKSRELLLGDTVLRNMAPAFTFSTAQVISNPLNNVNNFMLLNKGKADGIEQEMGVFNSNGVVGIVYQASENYSLVLPLLNSKSRVSCRIRGGDGSNILQWDGKETEFSYLVDIALHKKFEKGDTVVTSGYSEIFPEEIPVGVIDAIDESADGMFYRARVKLFVDFHKVNSVFIVRNNGLKEQKELKNNIQPE